LNFYSKKITIKRDGTLINKKMTGKKLFWKLIKNKKDEIVWRNPYWAFNISIFEQDETWTVEAPGHDEDFTSKASAIRDARNQMREIDKIEAEKGFPRKR